MVSCGLIGTAHDFAAKAELCQLNDTMHVMFHQEKLVFSVISDVRNERLSKGFAHRFRPTYPGFPVGVGGVEQLHAAFFERKPHARSWLVLRSRKSGQRWCERRAPVWSCGARTRFEG
jgi:hypothetical protein